MTIPISAPPIVRPEEGHAWTPSHLANAFAHRDHDGQFSDEQRALLDQYEAVMRHHLDTRTTR